MTAATININPVATTVAAGTFGISSSGYIQGTALNDPSVRFALAGGILGPNETLPMWGGIPVSESTTPVNSAASYIGGTLYPERVLGGYITRATAVPTLTGAAYTGTAGMATGFSVFDQNHAMINTPQSPVPVSLVGMMVNFYRFGSGARIAVPIEAGFAAALEGGIITQQCSWDFNDQLLQEYVASGATESVTSMTWSATNGGQVAVVMAAPTVFVLGDTVNVSGVTNTGSAPVANINTAQVINTWTDTTHFTFLLPGTSAQYGTFGGTIVLNVGIGALPVRILDIAIGTSMTVSYNATTGFATWNRSGNTAIILI